MGLLQGKVAIVTGGSSGIGLCTGHVLARNGATSVLVARRESVLREAVESILSKGWSAEYYAADVGQEDDVAGVIEGVIRKFGKIDILVNNAGLGYRGAIDELPVAFFDEMMRTNVRGAYLFTRYALQFMKKQKSGYIVYISSGAGKNGIAELSGYCASKFAIMGLSESVALEAKPFNVKVSILCPGSTNTEFHRNMTPPLEESQRVMIQPEDIAETIFHMVTTPDTYWIYEVNTRAFLKGRK